MLTRFTLCVGVFCLAAGAANAQAFSCPGFGDADIRITLIEGTDAAIAEFVPLAGSQSGGADPVTMRADPTADVLTYTGDGLVLRASDDAPELTAGGTTQPCGLASAEEPAAPAPEQPAEIIEDSEAVEPLAVVESEPAAEEVPQDPSAEAPTPVETIAADPVAVAAISLGGNLRAGPGTDFEDIGGLDEGSQITLQADTGVVLNGFNWWEIVLPNGTTAFQWGGVICVPGGGVSGVVQDPDLCPSDTSTPTAEALVQTPAPAPAGALPALSLGGNLRSGPGTAFPDIGDAAPGTEITLLSDSGIPFDGYNWWEIELPNGEIAFQWGGVICVPDGGVPGILAACP